MISATLTPITVTVTPTPVTNVQTILPPVQNALPHKKNAPCADVQTTVQSDKRLQEMQLQKFKNLTMNQLITKQYSKVWLNVKL